MKKTLRHGAIAAILLATQFLSAQSFNGLNQSNYSGILGADINPAALADNLLKFDLVLFQVNLSVFNNYKYYNGQVGFSDSNLYDDGFNYTNRAKDGKPVGYYQLTQLDYLSFFASIDENQSIGVTFRTRMASGVNQASPELVRLAEADFLVPDLWNMPLQETWLNQSVFVWNEYGFNYARTVYADKQHFVKAGAKIKLLQSVGSNYMQMPNSDYEFINDDIAINTTGEVSYAFNNDMQNVIDLFTGNGSITQLFGKGENWGVGFDVGGFYEWRPDYEKYQTTGEGGKSIWKRDVPKYKIRAGLAFNDIGGVRFSNVTVKTFDMTKDSLDIRIFDDVDDLASFDSIMEANFDKLAQADNYYMWLPTNMNFTVDYAITEEVFVDFIANIGLHGIERANKVFNPNQFQITPRWERSWITVAVPIGYNKFAGFRYGLGLRLGPLTLGTGDLIGLLSRSNVRGAEVYAGLRIPIAYK